MSFAMFSLLPVDFSFFSCFVCFGFSFFVTSARVASFNLHKAYDWLILSTQGHMFVHVLANDWWSLMIINIVTSPLFTFVLFSFLCKTNAPPSCCREEWISGWFAMRDIPHYVQTWHLGHHSSKIWQVGVWNVLFLHWLPGRTESEKSQRYAATQIHSHCRDRVLRTIMIFDLIWIHALLHPKQTLSTPHIRMLLLAIMNPAN